MRATYRLQGERAACDVSVTLAKKRDAALPRAPRDADADAEAQSTPSQPFDMYAYVPRSIAHAVQGADMFSALGVDCSLPATRGGGRAGLVSLMRDDDGARGDHGRKTK